MIIKELALEEVYLPGDPAEWMIVSCDVNRPGLALSGYFDYFDSDRIQILGKSEIGFLENLPGDLRAAHLNELMEHLRLCLQRDDLDESKRFLIKGIRLQVINALRGDPFSANALAALVNHIRKRTEAYPQWAYSDTAKLFAPPVYHNTKKSAGYWF